MISNQYCQFVTVCYPLSTQQHSQQIRENVTLYSPLSKIGPTCCGILDRKPILVKWSWTIYVPLYLRVVREGYPEQVCNFIVMGWFYTILLGPLAHVSVIKLCHTHFIYWHVTWSMLSIFNPIVTCLQENSIEWRLAGLAKYFLSACYLFY